MADDSGQILDLVVKGSIFLLVLSLWAGVVVYLSMRRAARTSQVKRRLGTEKAPSGRSRTLHLWHGGKQASVTAPALPRRRSLLGIVQRQCARAGWNIGAGQLILLVGGMVVIGSGLIVFITGNFVLSAGVGIALFLVFRLYMAGRITRREALFDTQLTNAMDLAARSLRAGHPLAGAFQLIAEETAPPVQTVFADLCQRHSMGASLEESLRDVATASSSTDLRLFATSVAIQMKVGGNLAQLIDRLSKVIRERMRLSRRLNVLTAQTQMSKRVLIVLPFFVFIVFNLINPGYMSAFYTTDAGQVLLGVSAIGLVLGTFVMNRMAVLKY